MTIKRIWRGWTTPENARAYEALLKEEIFPGIEAKKIPGYQGIELLRRNVDGEVEFITIMTFHVLDNVIAFQGAEYQKSYVPDAAKKVLKRWDDASAHYDVKDAREYG